MKSDLYLSFISFVVTVSSSAVVFASPHPVQNKFAAFWAQFKTAVAKQDAQAVAGMTKLPFTIDRKALGRAKYIKAYDKLFGKLKSCIAKQKPVKDGESYSVFCGEQGLLFEQVAGEYKFVEFFAND